MGKKHSPLVIKHKDLLSLLCSLSSSEKVKLLRGAPNSAFHCLSEVFKNFLKENIGAPSPLIRKLRRHRDLIRKVSLKSTPIKTKRQLLLSRRGGGVLSTILPLAWTAIKSLFGLQ